MATPNSEPADALQGVTQITSDRALELDITYVCNMSCLQCNRVLGVLRSKECLTTLQIERMLQQSLELPLPFKEVRILGGEPTLHPQLNMILDIVNAYRQKVEGCHVSIWTHGYTKLVQDRIKNLPEWIEIHISPKKPVVGGEHFEAFLAAPVDYEEQHDKSYAEGCSQIGAGKCGVGFSPYGIYACPVAGAIDRVIGLNLGLKHASEMTTENFKEQCDKLCRYCGHFLSDHSMNLPKETISQTWKKIIESKGAEPSSLEKF